MAALLWAYDSLPKRGKPQGTVWTVLAGIVARRQTDGGGGGKGDAVDYRGGTLATGNRCLGRHRVRADGAVLNDCHAEVLAGRGLRWVLLRQACAAANGFEGSLLELGHDLGGGHKRGPKLRMKRGTPLHLCVTESPCGGMRLSDLPLREVLWVRRVGDRSNCTCTAPGQR